MAWITIKSAGDDYNFVAMHVNYDVGHPQAYAQWLAEEMTKAMREYRKKNPAKRPCICTPSTLATRGCECGAKFG
jgi:hypothetical protein